MSERREPDGTVSKRGSWSTLIAWGVAIAILAALGTGITGRLAPMSLEVPGTPSSRAEAMLRAKFGNTIPIAILLKGSPRQLDSQGQRLVAALRGIPQVQVLSPWDQGNTMSSLRPNPGAAFVLVNYIRPPSDAMAVVPDTEAVIARTVKQPVHTYLTGVAVIGRALQEATMSDTLRAETIALPVLILVLLLVFRSPVAAVVPLVMGGATVMAGHGLLWLASFLTPINSLGVAIAAMMSLALGVDYALLMVSRVRQELAEGWDYEAAVAIASRTAGRTIAAAGGTLALTMLAASAVATPGLLGPVAIGVVISGLLSVALALSAMPALLRLLGPRLNRWEIRLPGSRREGRRHGVGALAERMIAHPAITVPLILAGMLALAAPAGALRVGPPDAAELPASSPARQAVEMVEHTIGPGWSAPFVIVASAREGAITTQRRLQALMKWQETIARDPDVAAVLGPASVAGARSKLAQAHAALVSAPGRLEGAQRGITGLRTGLSRASDGVTELRSGLASAASGAKLLGGGDQSAESGAQQLASETGRGHTGARQLASETGRAHTGAKRLASETGRAHAGAKRLASETGNAGNGAKQLQTGLAQTAAGSAQLAEGLDEASAGAERLARSDGQLTTGAAQLAQGMDTLDNTVHAVLAPIELLAEQLHAWTGWIASLRASEEQLRSRLSEATRQLAAMTVGREDPHYQALAQDLTAITQLTEQGGLSQLARIQQQLLGGLEGLANLPAELSQLTAGLDQLRSGSDRLATGTRESEEGAIALHSALQRLATGGHSLNSGLTGLSGGAGRLAGGLGRLTNGDARLAGGLGKLTNGDARLAGGLGRLTNGDARLAGGLGKLTNGNAQLAHGLGRLAAGDTQLASGLSAGDSHAGALAAGLGQAQGAAAELRDDAGQLPAGLPAVARAGPERARLGLPRTHRARRDGLADARTGRPARQRQRGRPGRAHHGRRLEPTQLPGDRGSQQKAAPQPARARRGDRQQRRDRPRGAVPIGLHEREHGPRPMAGARTGDRRDAHADRGPASAAAATDRRRAEPRDDRRGTRSAGAAHRAARARRARLHRRGLRRGHPLDHVRPLNRLRGLPADAHARAVDCHRRLRGRDPLRPAPHRGRDHRLRGDHDGRLPRVRWSQRHPTAPVRRWADDRGCARRDDRQARPATGDHAHRRPAHMVDAALARAQTAEHRAHVQRARHGQRREAMRSFGA